MLILRYDFGSMRNGAQSSRAEQTHTLKLLEEIAKLSNYASQTPIRELAGKLKVASCFDQFEKQTSNCKTPTLQLGLQMVANYRQQKAVARAALIVLWLI